MTARKEGLERSHPVVALSHSEAARLLRPLIGSARIAAVELLPGGLGNSNYLVRLDRDAPFMVLRLHARGAAVRDVEASVFRLVRGRVPVPRVLAVGDDAVDGTRPYMVIEQCPGRPLNDLLPDMTAAQIHQTGHAVGAVLAAIAEVTFDRPGLLSADLKPKSAVFPGSDPYLDFVQDCLFKGRAGRSLGESLRDRVWHFVSEHGSLCQDLAGERTLVHADFDGTNILVDVRGAPVVSGVIDWEYALSGHRVIDLSSMVRYPEHLPAGFERALLAGFERAGGVLPDEWEILVRLVDIIAFCAFLNKESAAARRRIFETALRKIHAKLSEMGY